MRFKALTNEQLNEKRGMLAEGDGDFEVGAAEETTSKRGNHMLKLSLRVWDKNGKEGFIFDYITDDFEWKIKHLLESIGEGHKYQTEEVVPSDLIGKRGKCKIAIQKDKGFGEQPKIKDYVPKSEDKVELETKKELPNFEDDTPF